MLFHVKIDLFCVNFKPPHVVPSLIWVIPLCPAAGNQLLLYSGMCLKKRKYKNTAAALCLFGCWSIFVCIVVFVNRICALVYTCAIIFLIDVHTKLLLANRVCTPVSQTVKTTNACILWPLILSAFCVCMCFPIVAVTTAVHVHVFHSGLYIYPRCFPVLKCYGVFLFIQSTIASRIRVPTLRMVTRCSLPGSVSSCQCKKTKPKYPPISLL